MAWPLLAAAALLVLIPAVPVCAARPERVVLGPGNVGHRPLDEPIALAVAPDGSLLVLDVGYHEVFRVRDDGKILARFGARGDGPGEFRNPTDLAVDAQGSTCVLDRGNLRFVKFDAAGEFLWARPSRGQNRGLYLNRLCIGSDGSLLATEAGADVVHRFDAEGEWLASWDASDGSPGLYRRAPALAADAGGHVGLTDRMNGRVVIYAAAGRPVRRWFLPHGEDGARRDPVDLAFGPDGGCAVLVSSPEPEVLRFDSTGVFRESWPLRHVESAGAIAVDAGSEVFVADPDGSRLNAYDPDWMLRAEAERIAWETAWRESDQLAAAGSSLFPVFSEEATTLTGMAWFVGAAARLSPKTTLEYRVFVSHSNESQDQTLVGNPYLGFRWQESGSSWRFRFGTQLPASPDGLSGSRMAALYANVENRAAYFPDAIQFRPEAERSWKLGDQWGFATMGAISMILGWEELGEGEIWIEYRGEARQLRRWARVRGGWSGRWTPGDAASLPRGDISVVPLAQWSHYRDLESNLGDLQNQVYLKADFLPGRLRPAVEVRWWVEDAAREVAPIVLGFQVEYNYMLP